MKEKMKRIILAVFLACAVCTVCAFASCGGKQVADDVPTPTPPTEEGGQTGETKDPYEDNLTSDGGIWTGVHGK